MTAAWVVAITLVGGVLLGVFRVVLDAPVFAQAFIVFLMACGYINAVIMAAGRCTVSSDGIQVSRFTSRDYAWSDVEGWTRWGDRGVVFVRFNGGRVYGTDGPSFPSSQASVFAQLLSEHAGQQLTGENGILPWYLEHTIGGFMRGHQRPPG